MAKYVITAPPRCLHTQKPSPLPSQHHSDTLDNEGKKGSTTSQAKKRQSEAAYSLHASGLVTVHVSISSKQQLLGLHAALQTLYHSSV
eukprot:831234-Ditylum_brightwellii.AAC.1